MPVEAPSAASQADVEALHRTPLRPPPMLPWLVTEASHLANPVERMTVRVPRFAISEFAVGER